MYEWANKTIVVAEDEDINYMFLNAVISRTKAKIFRAKTGAELIQYIEAGNKVDIILMDIKMPEVDGIEATKLIKEKYNIPIIAQTAFALLGEREQILKMGCDDYISKPYRGDDILTMIDKWL